MARFSRVILLAACAAFAAGCLTSPASAARQAQQLNDIGDQLNDLRNQNANLESSLDSLRAVLAKHDSSLARLAAATGVQVVK